MQEIKKRRIVIASVLKPVNDTRMLEKIGVSLSRAAEVHIVGYPAESQPYKGITFHASRPFRRLSFSRLRQPWRFLKLLFKLNPTDVIVSTHELLLPAVVYKLLRGVPLYYDLQENYWRNILYLPAFPGFIRPIIALYVRAKERLLSPLIEKYLVAESVYLKEMPFIRGKSIVIENRYIPAETRLSRSAASGGAGLKLIFSGTLARSTGVFRAVELAGALHQQDSSVTLRIVGHCPREHEYNELRAGIAGLPYISLVGGAEHVPHNEIIRHIRECTFGVIAYDINPATQGSIPTKFFEYLAEGLTLITPPHPPWLEFIRRFQEPVVFDPATVNAESLLAEMTRKAGKSVFPPRGLLWEEVEPRLLALFPPIK